VSIGLVTATAAGRAAADRLTGSLAEPPARYPVAEIATAFGECSALVCFLAVGATVRLIAPLLGGKAADPGVVCVDEAARFAVAVLGGHAGGANRLARTVADALGGQPVVTTATDATGIAALDELGWPVEGDLAAVTRAMLDGEPVHLVAEAVWPLPPLPVRPAGPDDPDPPPGAARLVVSDRLVDPARPAVIARPPSLVAGVGASRGAGAEEVVELLESALAEAGLAAGSLRELATVTAKADEPGLRAAARRFGVPLVTHPAERLAALTVPNPSEAVRAAVGTPSVAEAAALVSGGELVVAKRRSAHATVAIARLRPRGRLALVGLGPGSRDLLTPRALAELRRASVVIGLDSYLAQVADLLRPGTRIAASGLGAEAERAGLAARLARAGHAVAVVGSGDAGVYAMGSPVLEALGADADVDVLAVPGVSAMHAAAAILGAPLGHDHAAISLSDLHTPWPAIERRVRAAGEGDFVVAFYNPRSRGRDWQLSRALGILAEHRPASTPVGVVTDADRPGQRATLTSLAAVDVTAVGMTSLVIVGASTSRVVAGRFLTPRGYAWA
jgi:cobalt-precorrin 5A hydrolase/precorrin-3B C17-methyltransferase